MSVARDTDASRDAGKGSEADHDALCRIQDNSIPATAFRALKAPRVKGEREENETEKVCLVWCTWSGGELMLERARVCA